MQKFFTDTLISRFIKYMLTQVNIPLLPCVNTMYPLYEGVTYLYDNNVIKCTKSGALLNVYHNGAYPNIDLFPASYLFPGEENIGGYVSATYDKIKNQAQGINSPLNYYTYHSSCSYYDPETHKHLGNYLRYLRDCYNLDLMPYYNCYNQKIINNVRLINSGDNFVIKQSFDDNYRLLIVPIKYNYNYTIALQSSKPVMLRAVVWNNHMIKDSINRYYSNYESIKDSFKYFSQTKFNEPFLYNVSLENELKKENIVNLYSQIDNLYLIIQVDKSVNSSLVVLEGDYTNLNTIECYTPVLDSDESYDNIRKQSLGSKLSLLYLNDGNSYPFSSRLVEYLLGNVISQYDTLTGNIRKSQIAVTSTLQKLNSNNNYKLLSSPGVWNEKLKQAIFNLTNTIEPDNFYQDLDGNINKDVEQMFWLKGGIDLAKLR